MIAVSKFSAVLAVVLVACIAAIPNSTSAKDRPNQSTMKLIDVFEELALEDIAEIQMLISEGADVNLHGTYGIGHSNYSTLHVAVKNGFVEIARLLLKEGVDVESISQGDITPLWYAAYSDNVELINLLLTSGADPGRYSDQGNGSPLYIAAGKGKIEFVQLFIAAGADVNGADSKGNKTPLVAAILGNHGAVIEALIDAGADMDIVDNGSTPLSLAAAKGLDTLIVELLSRGADLELGTPLCSAASSGASSAAQLLIDAGADVDARDTGGDPPIVVAAMPMGGLATPGHEEIMRMLIESGADVNLCGNRRTPALFYVAQNGKTEIVRLLIAANANVDQTVNGARTPLYQAAQGGYLDIVEILIGAGADVNRANMVEWSPDRSTGWTPLMISIFYGHTNVAERLHTAGASDEPLTSSGKTARSIAEKKGLLKELPFLLE